MQLMLNVTVSVLNIIIINKLFIFTNYYLIPALNLINLGLKSNLS